VREATSLRSYAAEAMVRYASGGWRADVRASALTGPGGPWSLAQFYALRVVDGAVALHEPLARRTGMPPPLALFALLLAAVAMATAAVLACSVWLSPARRRPAVAVPAPAARPHAD
jgi:hypothetical protein